MYQLIILERDMLICYFIITLKLKFMIQDGCPVTLTVNQGHSCAITFKILLQCISWSILKDIYWLAEEMSSRNKIYWFMMPIYDLKYKWYCWDALAYEFTKRYLDWLKSCHSEICEWRWLPVTWYSIKVHWFSIGFWSISTCVADFNV